MKHIISNPHNGAPVDHLGVKLEPGYSLHVRPEVAEALRKVFEFLLVHVVPGTETPPKKNAPVKIKGTLNWQHEVPSDEEPGPHAVVHVAAQAGKKKK